jgi:exopolysaccharide biosynthesis protein
LCKTKKSILFITIDGRMEKADGMSLVEAQKYLYDLGCIDAINLDGGGSTTMWTKNKGVVNKPSDKDGERPVANAVLILENE